MAKARLSKLETLIENQRDPTGTLNRLKEEGLLLEDVEDDNILSLIISAFSVEAGRAAHFEKERLRYLERGKKELRSQEPGEPMPLDPDEPIVPPGDDRASVALPDMLRPYLSNKGRLFSSTYD